MGPVLSLRLGKNRTFGVRESAVFGRPEINGHRAATEAAGFKKARFFIPLENSGVSRNHLGLIERDGVWYVRDLGSMNGSYLNGQLMTPEIEYRLDYENNFRVLDKEFVVNGFYERPACFGVLVANSGGDITRIENNVIAMRDVLERRGFSDLVTLIEGDVTLENIDHELIRIKQSVEEGSQVVVYLAGHGGEEGLFLGKNNSGRNRRLRLVSIYQKLKEIDADKLIIYDACHSGVAVESLLRYHIPDRTFVFAGTQKDNEGHSGPRHAVMEDYPGPMLWFTAEIIKYLKGHPEEIEASFMAREIRRIFETEERYVTKHFIDGEWVSPNQVPAFRLAPFRFRRIR